MRRSQRRQNASNRSGPTGPEGWQPSSSTSTTTATAEPTAQAPWPTASLAPLPPPLPSGRVVSVPGRGEMFVREHPGPTDGPVILLLHGWTASADLNWFPLYEPLSMVGQVIAIDHRGHGRGLRSEEPFSLEAAADDAAALLAHLGHEQAVAVGYSMGGPIAMLLWQRHRHLVSGLIFEATALEWRGSVRERLMWKVLAAAKLVFRLGPNRSVMDRYLRQVVERSPELSQWQGWLKGEMRRGDPAALAQAGQALGRYDVRPFAGTVDIPTAVVVTTRDRLVRPQKQRTLAKAIPHADSFDLDADHDAPLTHPLELAAATTKALASVLGRSRRPRAAAASAAQGASVDDLVEKGRAAPLQ